MNFGVATEGLVMCERKFGATEGLVMCKRKFGAVLVYRYTGEFLLFSYCKTHIFWVSRFPIKFVFRK